MVLVVLRVINGNLYWNNLLGDYIDSAHVSQGSTPFASATPSGQAQWLEINVTSLVNLWLDKELANHGFRIETLTTGIRVSSREGEYPPQLVIDGTTHTVQRDTTLHRSTYLANGFNEQLVIQGNNSSVSNVALLYFGLEELPTNTTNATLRLYVDRQFSGTHSLGVYATTIDKSLVPPTLEVAPLTETYASESALCNDPNVLLCEPFENSSSNIWSGKRDDISYVSGYEGLSVRTVIPTGKHLGASFEYYFPQD